MRNLLIFVDDFVLTNERDFIYDEVTTYIISLKNIFPNREHGANVSFRNGVYFVELFVCLPRNKGYSINEIEFARNSYAKFLLKIINYQAYIFLPHRLNHLNFIKSHPNLICISNYDRIDNSIVRMAFNHLLKTVSIIIISYNNLDLTINCLNSIVSKTFYENFEVIVVDNNSNREVKENLREYVSQYSFINLIENEMNLGFAKANNIAIERASGDYIVLLNNDTEVSFGWLGSLINRYQIENADIVGPVTNNIGNEAKIYLNSSQKKEDIILAGEQFAKLNIGCKFEPQILAFYCVLFSRDIVAKCGLLSEDYGLGMYEDDDFCARIREIGGKIACVKDVFIYHVGSASFDKLKSQKLAELYSINRATFENKFGLWCSHDHSIEYRLRMSTHRVGELSDELVVSNELSVEKDKRIGELSDELVVLNELSVEKDKRIGELSDELVASIKLSIEKDNRINELSDFINKLSSS